MTRALVPIALAGLFLTAGLGAPARAAPEPSIVVAGRIENGTTGGGATRGLRVEAAAVAEDGTRGQPLATEVDGGGTFRLPPMPRADHVVVATRYRGVIYSTSFAPRPGRLQQVRLAVFEPTSADDAVRLQADTTIVDRRPGDRLEVLHVLRVQNAGERTFVGERVTQGRAVVRLPVPQGAQDLAPEEGTSRIVEVDGAFYSTSPLQPGTARLSFSYSLHPEADDVWAIAVAERYPTRRVDLLVGPGLDVAPGPIRLLGELDFRGTAYRQYRVPRAEVDGLELRLRSEAPEDGGTPPLPVVVAAALGLGAAAVGLRTLSKRRSAGPRSTAVGEIAALDVAFENGLIGDHEYHSRRTSLKRRLHAETARAGGDER